MVEPEPKPNPEPKPDSAVVVAFTVTVALVGMHGTANEYMIVAKPAVEKITCKKSPLR